MNGLNIKSAATIFAFATSDLIKCLLSASEDAPKNTQDASI